jgi:hypothetical protein
MENDLLEDVLKHLRDLPEMQVEEIQSGAGHDGLLRLTSSLATVEYVFECKMRSFNPSDVELIINKLRRIQELWQRRVLLMVWHISEPAAQLLRQQKIEYVDAGGNMYLKSPAAYVLISGQPAPARESARKRQSLTAATLKLVYVFLRNPESLQFTQRELSKQAGISLDAVNGAIKTLQESNYLVQLKHKKNRLADYEGLLERWESGYIETLRQKLFIGNYTFIKLVSQQEKIEAIQHQANQGKYLIGGELGAAMITSYLRPQRFTLHVEEQYRTLMPQLLLKPDPQGEVTFIRQFGTENPWTKASSLADPLLVHAELLTSTDDRLLETADILLDEYIKPQDLHDYQ